MTALVDTEKQRITEVAFDTVTHQILMDKLLIQASWAKGEVGWKLIECLGPETGDQRPNV